jgi:hypothetical protein
MFIRQARELRIAVHKVIDVKPLDNYRVWLRFSDGVEGTADLSHLVGKGVFKAWEDKIIFKSVFIDSRTHTIAWQDGIDLCPDKLYADITGEDPLTLLNNKKTTAR